MVEYVTTFAIREGRVPSLSAQLSRLRDGAAIPPDRVADLRSSLHSLSPGAHRLIVQASQGAVSSSIRPLKEPGSTNILDSLPITDARQHPKFKGPDLGWQNRQLAQLRARGADEGLLIEDNGRVVSAVRSSLLVISDGEVRVPATPRTTYSVTAAAVLARLAELGVQVHREVEGLTLGQLRTSEVWTINSVAGIQRVTGWLEYGSVLPTRRDVRRGGVPTASAMEAYRWATAEDI